MISFTDQIEMISMNNKYEKWRITFEESITKKFGQRQEDGTDIACPTSQVKTNKF